jgi:hypothetical protein
MGRINELQIRTDADLKLAQEHYLARLEEQSGKYALPYQYLRWADLLKSLRKKLLAAPSPERPLLSDAELAPKTRAAKAAGLIAAKAPARTLSFELGRDLLNSQTVDTPRDRIFLPAFHLMLPKGLITTPGVETYAISVIDTELLLGLIPQGLLDPERVLRKRGATYIVHTNTHTVSGTVFYGEPLPLRKTPDRHEQSLSEQLFDHASQCKNLVSAVFNYMAMEPEDRLESDNTAAITTVSPKEKSWKAGAKPLLPVCIGEAARSPKATDTPAVGADPSYKVSPHARRGHFREQVCGPGGRSRKLIWVHPTIVHRAEFSAA